MSLADKCLMASQQSLSPFLGSQGAETTAAGEEQWGPAGGPGAASTVGSALPTHLKDLGYAGAEMDVGTVQMVSAGFGC